MKIKQTKLVAGLLISLMMVVPQVFADNDDDGTGDSTVTVPAHSKDAIGNVLLQSISLMGIPYRWGGNTPETGMDCSGFIRYVFQKSLGITLPRTAAEMSKVGKRVSLDDLEPGDLLFFNTGRGSNTHIGMYIGDNKFIQSPHTGETIQITQLNSTWRAKLNGAKRIVQENEDDDGNTVVEDYQEVRDEALPSYSFGKHQVKKGHGKNRRKHLKVTKTKLKVKKNAQSNKSTKLSKKKKKRSNNK